MEEHACLRFNGYRKKKIRVEFELKVFDDNGVYFKLIKNFLDSLVSSSSSNSKFLKKCVKDW